ncbi:MAG: hypothetical protein M3Q98_08965 [Actinomycetota bacterium]|nr:hypothetical protein [Actinomycetota bacterium]
MFTTASRAQRGSAFAAVIALFLGLLMFAAPVQAADTDSAGTEAPAPVVAAAAIEVTPNAVTFPDECTVLVPATTGVKYTATVDGETEDVPADTYDGVEFFGDSAAVFKAVAQDGYVLADGATATWTQPELADSCFDEIGNDELVSTKTSCSAVTFTNLTDEPIEVFYGTPDEDLADGDITIPAGGSRKVSTSRAEFIFAAVAGDDPKKPTGIQIDVIEVPQNCGADPDDSDPSVKWPIKHPTSAPAAGVVADNGGASVPAMALLGALALIAVRRSYALGR